MQTYFETAPVQHHRILFATNAIMGSSLDNCGCILGHKLGAALLEKSDRIASCLRLVDSVLPCGTTNEPPRYKSWMLKLGCSHLFKQCHACLKHHSGTRALKDLALLVCKQIEDAVAASRVYQHTCIALRLGPGVLVYPGHKAVHGQPPSRSPACMQHMKASG